MKKYNYEAKTLEEAKAKALEELKINEDDLIVKVLEEKSSLLKKQVKIEVININELINYIKETITTMTNLMQIETNLEVRRREKTISVKIFSDNNAILIGKNGRIVSSLQMLVRQMISNYTDNEILLTIDVENYREKRNKNIEFLAKKIAKEVAKTKTEAKLDSMNSYERRIIHSALSENKYVYTISEGTEPNRYVVIKPKED